jgi:hypothetical protein
VLCFAIDYTSRFFNVASVQVEQVRLLLQGGGGGGGGEKVKMMGKIIFSPWVFI